MHVDQSFPDDFFTVSFAAVTMSNLLIPPRNTVGNDSNGMIQGRGQTARTGLTGRRPRFARKFGSAWHLLSVGFFVPEQPSGLKRSHKETKCTSVARIPRPYANTVARKRPSGIGRIVSFFFSSL